MSSLKGGYKAAEKSSFVGRAWLYRLLKNPALYQGTTLVVPYLLETTPGFSPCGSFEDQISNPYSQ
jgi:hypothetical protein